MGEFQNLKLGNALFLLKGDLVRQQFISNKEKVNPEADCLRNLNREDILQRIEVIILKVVQDIAAENPPKLTYPSTTDWKDVCFEPGSGIGMRQNLRMTTIRFESLQSVKKLDYIHEAKFFDRTHLGPKEPFHITMIFNQPSLSAGYLTIRGNADKP